MRERRISNLYEDFEPEMRVWPYFALAFLIPLVPLALTFLLQTGPGLSGVLLYAVSVLPLLATGITMRDGTRAWVLFLPGLFHFVYHFVLWTVNAASGLSPALGIPLPLALSPLALSFASYAFFQKRRRGRWAGAFILSLLSSLLFSSLLVVEKNIVPAAFYPFLLVLLSLLLPLVTRRSESTPPFILPVLVLLLFSSFSFHSGALELFSSPGFDASLIPSVILGVFVHDNGFWYTLSYLFVFAGLSGKSSYRTIDVETEDDTVFPEKVDGDTVVGRSYSYPPASFSYASDEDRGITEESVEEERDRVVEEKTPPVRDRSREGDDRWYDFLQGGVRDDVPRPYSGREGGRCDERRTWDGQGGGREYYERESRDRYREAIMDDRRRSGRYGEREGRDRYDYMDRRDYPRDSGYDGRYDSRYSDYDAPRYPERYDREYDERYDDRRPMRYPEDDRKPYPRRDYDDWDDGPRRG